MTRQVFDDGSWLDFDDAGNVTSVAPAGSVVDLISPAFAQPNSPVIDQFIQGITGSVSAAVNRFLSPSKTVAAPVQKTTSSPLVPLLLIGGLFFGLRALQG